jgi:hypothetical protein
MSETTETTSEGTQVATETVSTGYIRDDGNFTEDWMEKAGIPEEMRSNQTLMSTKNLASMSSQLINAQSLIGKNANMAVIPTEQSTDLERTEFNKLCGCPDTPDEYTITHAEDIGEVNAEVEMGFKNLAHSHGLRPETVQALTELDDARMLAMRQGMADAKIQAKADCEEALKKQWGGAFEERMHLANRMVAENATEENKQAILDVIGNNPIAADFLANMAKKFVEHKVISADINTPTPLDAKAQADDLRNTPGYISGELANTSPARYKQITKDIASLMEQAYPEPGN